MRAWISTLVWCAVVVNVLPASAQTWDIKRPVTAGATTISGFVPPNTMSITLEVTAPGDTPASGGPPAPRRVVDRQVLTPDVMTGAFEMKSSAVRVGYQVQLFDGAGMAHDMTSVARLQAPIVRGPIRSGSRVVEGEANSSNVIVTVRSTFVREGTPSGAYLQRSQGAVKDGIFEVVLREPVIGGQRIEVVADTGGDQSEPVPLVVNDPGDWGRIRSYFSGGVVLSKDRGDFSDQDLAMSFTLDKSWFQRQAMTLPADCDALSVDGGPVQSGPCARREPGGGSTHKERGSWFRQLNTFFDARLTALPVKEKVEEVSGGTPPPAAPAAPPSGLDEFIASRKGAVVQIGAYAPWYGPSTSWLHEGRVNSLFVAPVGRFGIQTITEDPEVVVADGEASTAVPTAGENDDVFHFWSIGLGVGHYRLTGTRNEAPELISYLHVTWGKSEAFEFTPEGATEPKRPLRAFVEGRLKIPDTALQVGFDANLGEGPDDVRFIFGTRFDIGAVIGRMRQLN